MAPTIIRSQLHTITLMFTFLAVPVTSAPTERVFGIPRKRLRSDRDRLFKKSFANFVLFKVNHDLI